MDNTPGRDDGPTEVDVTSTSVRAFFALVPDEAVRLQFVARARDVARRSRGRPVSGEHVHLTLAFLGDTPASALPSLRAIGFRLPARGAALDFDVLGAWRASGVAWTAPSELPAPLIDLHAALRQALIDGGFALDARAFRPHVTLARRCVQPQPRTRCAPIHWAVNRLCLIGSQLRPEGPTYTELAVWPLAIAC
jgi:2'-5' RNA ligase